jgi:hypothetical protein
MEIDGSSSAGKEMDLISERISPRVYLKWSRLIWVLMEDMLSLSLWTNRAEELWLGIGWKESCVEKQQSWKDKLGHYRALYNIKCWRNDSDESRSFLYWG